MLAGGRVARNRVNAVGAVLLTVVLGCAFLPLLQIARAQGASALASSSALHAKTGTASKTTPAGSAKRFATRADALMDEGIAGRGQWGALVVDAESGAVLYQRDADRFFVPASNMKLLTSALALAKLGTAYRFRTTVE